MTLLLVTSNDDEPEAGDEMQPPEELEPFDWNDAGGGCQIVGPHGPETTDRLMAA